MDLLEGWNNFLPGEAQGANTETPYPVAADILGPLTRVHMPRAPRLVVPGDTVHDPGRIPGVINRWTEPVRERCRQRNNTCNATSPFTGRRRVRGRNFP